MADNGDAPGLRVEGLSLRYAGAMLFDDLWLTIPAGMFVALLGVSGVGKTSLLKIIAGLSAPDSGRVVATDGGALAGRMAYMGQTDLLYPWLSAVENVMLGARLRGVPRDRARALHVLERVGLGGRTDAMPAALSGGMRQRVALARTLYEDRPIVLMDEPFSGLDNFTRARVQDLAAEMFRGRTVLMITHDPLEACRLGDLLLVMSGAPAAIGEPIAVPGAAPRAADDPSLLDIQGRLMRDLTFMAAL